MREHTLGIIEVGRIGSAVASIGHAFDMKVLAWSSNLTDERWREAGVHRAGSLQTLQAESDDVTIHLTLGERSRGLIGAQELGLIRGSAFLVNTSRSGIVDCVALVDALAEGRIAGAGAGRVRPGAVCPPTMHCAPPREHS